MSKKLVQLDDALVEFRLSLSVLVCLEATCNSPDGDYSEVVANTLHSVYCTMSEKLEGIRGLVAEIREEQ